jgi:hypothetical protein
MAMAMVADELVRAETAAILRHARVIQIKRAALGLTDGSEKGKRLARNQKRRPRAVMVIPPRYAWAMPIIRACMVRSRA